MFPFPLWGHLFFQIQLLSSVMSPRIFQFSIQAGYVFFSKSCLRITWKYSWGKLEDLSNVLLSKLKRQEVKPTINLSRIKKGVLCEICEYKFQMHYRGGTWHCPNCSCRNKKSILQAFHDYRVLVSNKITNREFREFFGIESIDAASKILIRLGLETVGEKRGRYYLIPTDIFTK